MTDIVERLRGKHGVPSIGDCQEAADEIDRLRAELRVAYQLPAAIDAAFTSANRREGDDA